MNIYLLTFKTVIQFYCYVLPVQGTENRTESQIPYYLTLDYENASSSM